MPLIGRKASAIPAAAAMIALIFGVREEKRQVEKAGGRPNLDRSGLDRRFWAYLGVLLLFTLGNSTDALLILRANELGVSAALIPVLWAVLSVVKSVSSTVDNINASALRDPDVPHDPCDTGDHSGRLDPEDGLDGRVRVCGGL